MIIFTFYRQKLMFKEIHLNEKLMFKEIHLIEGCIAVNGGFDLDKYQALCS